MSHANAVGDDEKLSALGYDAHFKRDMSLWANFSLGFTYLSPVVGIYTLFGSSLMAGGPPMIWSLVIVGVGQLLVALVFGEIVSQYPVAGGVYPWARRLWGKRWAWMTGWVYLFAMLATIASVAYGAGPYVAAFLGIDGSVDSTIVCALAILLIATVINMAGTRVLSTAAIIGFVAEIVGAIAVGGWLLAFHREHGLEILFQSFGAGEPGDYVTAFLAASLIGVFQYYGFEACGDVAEEVANPGRRIPKAMRMTIYVGGAAATFVCLALLLSVKDIGAVIAGEDTDPVSTALSDSFGPVGLRVVIGIVLLSFISCAMSLQAAASRLTYSYARDDMIVGSALLRRFDVKRGTPIYALLLAGIVPAVIVLGSKISEDATVKIISFAAFGIYLAFQMVVLAALRARLRGWKPGGEFTLGRAGLIVNVAALVYGVSAMVNLAWPRTPDLPWYDNWIVVLSAVVVVGAGVIYMLVTRHHSRSQAAAGDAITEAVQAVVPSSGGPSDGTGPRRGGTSGS